MVGRKEMDGKRLQREMMERRRDEVVNESVEEEAAQHRKKRIQNTGSNFKVYM